MDDDLLNDLLGIHDDHVVEDSNRTTIQRAPFAYMGGKTKSIPYLNKYIPYRKKWIDHFCGSGVVTFNRQESDLEVMNDRYGGIVAFYRCLRDKKLKDQLLEQLELMPHSREEFYSIYKVWCNETDDLTRAVKWYTMMRLSSIGRGVSFGRVKNPPRWIPIQASLKLFEPIHHRLRNIIIENLDFEICHRDYDGVSAVHYFDPPYVGTDSNIYVGDSWTRDDLARLLRCCERSQGFVALSGYADEQIDSCKFWTRRESWQVVLQAQPHAHMEENNKKHLKDIKNQDDYVTEVLWIKE